VSTALQIEKALEALPLDHARKVSDWLRQYLDQKWDAQIDCDIDSGVIPDGSTASRRRRLKNIAPVE
jgi:hypothetical protein